MSDTNERAKLRLRIIGPLQGDEALPMGATTWIAAGDDEPIIVSLPVDTMHEPVEVDVPAGRVVIILRTPAGRRGRQEVTLNPGEVKSIEFGTAKQKPIVIPEAILAIPVNRRRPPIDPNRIEQWHPPVMENDPEHYHSENAPLYETSGSGGNSGTGGQSGENHGIWMSQINKVRIYSQKRPGTKKFIQWVLQENAIPRGVRSFKSSTIQLELGMSGNFAFVVEPIAPHQTHLLFHRSPWTHELTRFTIKRRQDAAPIPIDTEVILAADDVMALLAFLANGDIPSARAQAVRFSAIAEGYLSRKFTNHHLAAVGAYALHALRETDKYAHWIKTLYEHFEDTADGAILYAMHLMRARPGASAEWYDEARTALVEAAARPIPMLTAGVHLLVDGLERLSSSRRAAGDDKLANALERAQWIRARTRPDEIFTALWMPREDLPKAFLPYNFSEVSAAR